MKSYSRSTLFFLFLILGSIVLYVFSFFVQAGTPPLGKFKSDTEKEEKEEKGSSSSSSSVSQVRDQTNQGEEEEGLFQSCCSSIGSEALKFLFQLNLISRYSEYPYERKDLNWIGYEPDEQALLWPVQNKGLEKRYFITADLGTQFIEKKCLAYYSSWQSRFLGVFGILFDYKYYQDENDALVLWSLGIDYALMQVYSFDLDFYIKYTAFKKLMEKDGLSLGSIIHIFPIKPLSFYFKAGRILFSDIEYWDLDGHVGIMLGRWEIYAGYQTLFAKYASLDGWQTGVKLWF
ncbi:MAG: hypothetical protein JW827_03935 [Spirochaetes bacterium]|nr:hypothetical protein [Spirochaetota bacterium]